MKIIMISMIQLRLLHKKVDSDKGSNIAARNVTGKYVYENRKVLCV